MSDRVSANIRFGGAVSRKNWKKVVDAIEEDAGYAFTFNFKVPADKVEGIGKKPTAMDLTLLPVRGSKTSRLVTFAIPARKIDRLVGVVLEVAVDEVAGGTFEALEKLLRSLGMPYVVESDAYTGAFPAWTRWWKQDDREREDAAFAPFYRGCERHIHGAVDMDGTHLRTATAEQIRAAHNIALSEFPTKGVGMSLDNWMYARVAAICTGLPELPVLTIVEP